MLKTTSIFNHLNVGEFYRTKSQQGKVEDYVDRHWDWACHSNFTFIPGYPIEAFFSYFTFAATN